MSEANLTRHDVPGRSEAVVLMLHGGQQQSTAEVGGRSASWLRSRAMQRSIAPRARELGVGVWLLRYRERGWNGGRDRVADARWALDEVRAAHGDVPITVLGHSMGARVAIHVADDPSVRGVVALAPWFPVGESTTSLAGKHLVAAHGRRDHITSFEATSAYVERARRVAASAELRDMGDLGHYLIKDASAWNEVALRASLAWLPVG